MRVIQDKITIDELKKMAEALYGNLVKAVVDIEKEILAVDAELHADIEALLLEQGSKQENLWGINLYPEYTDDRFIEYDSIINIRPSSGNKSRGVEDEKIRSKITDIIKKRV